jgi:hypothetical protein
MLTPYPNNGFLTPVQKNFNKTHSSVRVVVEHTIGCLKARFKVLNHIKLRTRRRQLTTIISCCVLHNLSSLADLEAIDELPLVPEEAAEVDNPLFEPEAAGVARRNAVANLLPR